ncbi:MAG: glycosyltransferase [Candidatus Methylumidiphilus sp.]
MTNLTANPAQSGEQPKLPEGAINLKESLRKYWHYGLVAALVVACAGSFRAYKNRNMYSYSVMAKVYIAPRYSTVLTEQKETDLDSYQKLHQFQEQQAIMVKSYDVALETLKNLNKGRKKISNNKPNCIWMQPPPKGDMCLPKDEKALEMEVRKLTDEEKSRILKEEEMRLDMLKEKNGPDARSDASDTYMNEDQDEAELERAQQELSDSPVIVEAKKRLAEAQAANELAMHTDAERLVGAIEATIVKDSYLMNISLKDTADKNNPPPLDKVLNRLVDVYLGKFKKETFFFNKDIRFALLKARRRQLEKKISFRMAQRTAIALHLGVTTFSENMINPFDQILLASKEAREAAERDLIAAKSANSVFEDDQGRENKEVLEAASFGIVSQDQTLNTLKGNVNLRRTKLLEMVSGLEESHPLKKNIDRELKEVNDELNRGTDEVSRRVGRSLVLQKRSEVVKFQGIVNGIKHQIEENLLAAKDFSEKYNLALGYNNEIKRLQNQLEEIETRKDRLMMESFAPSMARLESKALPPEKGSGGWQKLAVISAVASILIGLIVPVLVDFIKYKFGGGIRTINQVNNLLGHAPLAGLSEPSEELDQRRVTSDRKRRLAIALEREHQLQDSRLFLFTSVKPSAGVTDLVFDMALEFGDLGVKALALEVNAAKPDPRYSVDQFQTGLIDLINGEGSLDEAIVPASGSLPDRISIGYPVTPHLFGYEKLREILTALKTRYPVVLLDAPPILLSPDPEFLSAPAIADHTLLLIKARDVTTGELKKAVSILEKVAPTAVSFVVTNLEVYRHGGYSEKNKEYNAYAEKAKQTLRSLAPKKQDAIVGMKPIFLYALHSGNLYGTERMALYTLEGMRDTFTPVLLAPPGPALVEAEKMGIQAIPFRNSREFARRLRHQMSDHKQIAFAATGVTHSLAFNFWNFFYRRHAVHLHLVHGGTDERESYGRKKLLNGKKVKFVAVSAYVQERLIANGVKPGQITVVGNFLPDRRIQEAPRHPPFVEDGIRKVIVVSRVDPIKRVDLLLDAMDRHPELRDLPVKVFGTGWDLDLLRSRASESHPNVAFEGFSADVANELAASDLLLHLCPVEPFGLAILEAMAAGVPVLVPNQGGAEGLVKTGVSGFHFRADDADDLAAALLRVRQMPVETLNGIAAAASQSLRDNYSSSACLANYRDLYAELLDA